MKNRIVLNIFKKMGLLFTMSAVNLSCVAIFGQRKLPKETKQLRKF